MTTLDFCFTSQLASFSNSNMIRLFALVSLFFGSSIVSGLFIIQIGMIKSLPSSTLMDITREEWALRVAETTLHTSSWKAEKAILDRLKGPRECQFPNLSRGSNETIRSLWVASFPGSGSELFRSLVESITGLETDEVYNKATDCRNRPVICKTHWPLHIGGSARKWGLPPRDRKDHFARQVILLLRNPAKALPSSFNYKWEEKHKVPNHSLQGSEVEWREWRDRRFEHDMQAWKRLLLKWTPKRQTKHKNGGVRDEYYKVTLFVSYEEITKKETGPALLGQVAEQLRSVHTPTAAREDMECHWEQAVQQHHSKKRVGHSYEPGYTRLQQERMLEILQEVADELAGQTEVLRILDQYRIEIKQNIRIDPVESIGHE